MFISMRAGDEFNLADRPAQVVDRIGVVLGCAGEAGGAADPWEGKHC